MIFDRESLGMVKLALLEAREAERTGQLPKAPLALPPGTRMENGRVVFPKTDLGELLAVIVGALGSFGLVMLGLLGAGLAIAAVRQVLLIEVYGTPIYLALAAVICLLTAGILFFVARDIRKWRVVAVVQICVGLAGGTVGYFGASDSSSKWVIAGAAVVTIANGFDKLFKAKPK